MTEESIYLEGEAEMRVWASRLSMLLTVGDVVLLSGPLGVGKTTWVRGLLEGYGFKGAVRSPTFNLIQSFDTVPLVMHADLYRLQGYEGIGLEDYLETHLCLIEWPDRAAGLVREEDCWRLDFDFEGTGRRVQVRLPSKS